MSLERAWAAECGGLARREQSALREICSGSLRYLAKYERVIESLAPSIVHDTTLRLLATTTMYEIEQMSSKPRSLARRIDECCKLLQRGWAAPVLKDVAGASHSFSGHTESSELSLPGWLHNELASSTPVKKYARLLLERPDFLGLCVDPAVGSPAEYVEKLRAEGITASVSGLAPHAVVVHHRPRDVASLPGVRDGSVHVQDPSQQWACSLLDLPSSDGARVLDACAAPGGKTRALLRSHHHADLQLIAVERSKSKCNRLQEAFAADDRITVRCGDAAEPASWWDGEPFDAILADVPCSATGILRSRPEVKAHQVSSPHRPTSDCR